MNLTVEELRSRYNARVHGNGFLQLDLPSGDRLHLFDDRLPRQIVNTGIHNHRFSFRSTVLCGAILHTVYAWHNWVAAPYYYLMSLGRTEGEENTILVPTGEQGDFVTRYSTLVNQGQTYDFGAGLFHSTHHFGLTITLLSKVGQSNDPVYVACPIGCEPDNDFHRDRAEISDWAMLELVPLLSKIAS